jgi:hypothetical protein
MTEKPNPQDARKAAVQAFRDREAAAARAKEDQNAAEQDKAKVLAQNRQQWSTTAFDTIHRGVMASSEAFAREGSEYIIPPRPNVSADPAATYEIRPSGSLGVVATIAFAMGTDGMVRPSTTARGCSLPPASRRCYRRMGNRGHGHRHDRCLGWLAGAHP